MIKYYDLTGEMMKEFLTIEQAKKILGVTHKTIYNYFDKGILTKYKKVNRVLLDKDEVLSLAEPQQVETY